MERIDPMELPIERRLRETVEGLDPRVREMLQEVLQLPDDAQAKQIGELWSFGVSRGFAEMLIDIEESATIRVMVRQELERLSR